MNDRRGLELAIKTVILMILGMIILIGVIYMLTAQTAIFRQSTEGRKSNVDSVVSSCNSFVSTESYYAYCCEKKKVVFGKNAEDVELSCREIALQNWVPDNLDNLDCADITCVE